MSFHFGSWRDCIRKTICKSTEALRCERRVCVRRCQSAKSHRKSCRCDKGSSSSAAVFVCELVRKAESADARTHLAALGPKYTLNRWPNCLRTNALRWNPESKTLFAFCLFAFARKGPLVLMRRRRRRWVWLLAAPLLCSAQLWLAVCAELELILTPPHKRDTSNLFAPFSIRPMLLSQITQCPRSIDDVYSN